LGSVVLVMGTIVEGLVLDKSWVTKEQKEVLYVTKMLPPAFNLLWHEERFGLYEVPFYPPYPEMPSTDRLDFVYNIKPLTKGEK